MHSHYEVWDTEKIKQLNQITIDKEVRMKEYASPVELVKVFHTTYGQPIRTEPVFDAPEKGMRHDLIDEEIEELSLAYATYDFVEVIDALADIVYVVCGAGLTHGVTGDVFIERPLVLGSFPASLIEAEPFTDVQRKLMAAVWEDPEFAQGATGIAERANHFRVLVSFYGNAVQPKDTKSDEWKTWAQWQEINAKLDHRKVTIAPWFEDHLDNTVSILEKFNAANSVLHSAEDTNGLKEGWLELIALSYGTAFSYGVELDVVLEEVQASNLSKLAADGSVLRREDGKVLKGPNFFAPDIARVLKEFV
jgi:predicted HAD superfamily Cof-like phosphohydrolase